MPTYAITIRKTLVTDEVKIVDAENLEAAIYFAKMGDGPVERQTVQPGSTIAINSEIRKQ